MFCLTIFRYRGVLLSFRAKKRRKKKNQVFQIKKRVFRLILVFILTDVRQKKR